MSNSGSPMLESPILANKEVPSTWQHKYSQKSKAYSTPKNSGILLVEEFFFPHNELPPLKARMELICWYKV